MKIAASCQQQNMLYTRFLGVNLVLLSRYILRVDYRYFVVVDTPLPVKIRLRLDRQLHTFQEPIIQHSDL
jgi:hypothetical protein